jgi:hypothetical protein
VSLLSDDELMGELYKRLGEIGWSADAAPTLLGIVSDSKTFLHEPSNSVLKFLAQGEAAGVRLTVGGQPAFACDHASPQRINALLDVLQANYLERSADAQEHRRSSPSAFPSSQHQEGSGTSAGTPS